MNILCIFYGIGRGIELSEKSIISSLIEPIEKLGHNFSSIYILNELKNISNRRSGDYGNIDRVSNGVLNSSKIIRVHENAILNKHLLELSKDYDDKHNDDYVSNKNLLCQLELLRLSTDHANFKNFDRIIFCRDDLLFQKKIINWKNILNVSSQSSIVSCWGWHNGISERFVVSPVPQALKLATRILMVEKCLKHYKRLNGEELMHFTFNCNNFNPIAVNIKTWRVRLGGRLHNEKFNIAFWRPSEVIRLLWAVIRYYKKIYKMKFYER
ncbi:hypothetical protein N8474_00125 [Gammaproteobacteria bacterium]|nr:hypothetical protein [Gammaproteobacteria bacterium]